MILPSVKSTAQTFLVQPHYFRFQSHQPKHWCTLPSTTLFSLYNTLIFPYLNYCNIVWARTSTNKLKSLITVQKRAIRICTLSVHRDHTATLFARIHTLTITDINQLQTGILRYKYTNNLLPRTFSSYRQWFHEVALAAIPATNIYQRSGL